MSVPPSGFFLGTSLTLTTGLSPRLTVKVSVLVSKSSPVTVNCRSPTSKRTGWPRATMSMVLPSTLTSTLAFGSLSSI